jgi:hypothetical protein
MMLRARSQFDGALAMVTIFHGFVADAHACTVSALPFVPLNIAVVCVAQLVSLQTVKEPLAASLRAPLSRFGFCLRKQFAV